ncbi:MAG: DUF2256 domain-containing protein [Candidatus Thermochlorobacter aerophilum]|jgi:hypothetical protein|uniref:DUF2256 domain-containing protein n=1 Tax=Candidatus Thermochlorobacter aerophilus TaxID=1868324 RepID=A0A395M1W0_9BACT|nr:MAG: DUF2256 domain-containing protein [Candidatus Thermochlorobacter aerophilum]
MKTERIRYQKSNLPEKLCEHCHRPMAWRKAWAKNWENVKYCSERCRKAAKHARKSSITSPAQPKAKH